MKKFLFATHGTLATGMKSTLELLIGNTADITCLTAYVNPEDNVDEQRMYRFDGGKCQSESCSICTERKCISDSRIQPAIDTGTGNERG